MWMACHSQDEIAGAVDLSQLAVSEQCEGFTSSVFKNQTSKSAAEHTTDFKPPLYNVWKWQEKTDAPEHFGNSEPTLLDNLLYFFTQPFDVVVDPFAGGGSTIDVCKKRFRRYWVSDRKPIAARADQIHEYYRRCSFRHMPLAVLAVLRRKIGKSIDCPLPVSFQDCSNSGKVFSSCHTRHGIPVRRGKANGGWSCIAGRPVPTPLGLLLRHRYPRKTMTRRLAVYIAVAFGITWTCWWILVLLARARVVIYGQIPFMVLYALGGLGPTIAAYVAVSATRKQSPLSEFHRRLFRWRVAASWHVIAVGLPIILALVSAGIARLVDSSSASPFAVRPWYMFFLLFFFMIGGGGLEELGWRGVAQPEMERRLSRFGAAVLVGLLWALWHVPLFDLLGVGQYGTNFPLFTVGVVGSALMLAWLYARTGSILLCIAFHASRNAIWSLGATNPFHQGTAVWVDGFLGVVIGGVLVAICSKPSKDRWRGR